jgi:DNA segregation ATPase FtsK/SpoIIIE, S-DNA-T family
LLQSFISSLAVNFHPYQVSFVLVDYKGGGMADAFLELPHLAGSITNLQGNLASRALLALRSELQKRQAMLAQARENHIDKYQRRYAQGELKEPLPRIIIIVDEFAELATEQPDFMKQLVSTVRVGGSLGVHLILATQKPAGVVSEEIWANTRFRICLRVARPEDSREVLRRPDAASISQPGRAYFQVGLDEVFELFQSAYGGAPYVPESGMAAAPDEIMEVALDGSRNVLRLSPKPVAIQAPSGNQLQAIVAAS